MDNKEKAKITYELLQKRKIKKAKEEQANFTNFTFDSMRRHGHTSKGRKLGGQWLNLGS